MTKLKASNEKPKQTFKKIVLKWGNLTNRETLKELKLKKLQWHSGKRGTPFNEEYFNCHGFGEGCLPKNWQ